MQIISSLGMYTKCIVLRTKKVVIFGREFSKNHLTNVGVYTCKEIVTVFRFCVRQYFVAKLQITDKQFDFFPNRKKIYSKNILIFDKKCLFKSMLLS